MVGFPNKPMGFPTTNDQHYGVCFVGVPPFKEATILSKSLSLVQLGSANFFSRSLKPKRRVLNGETHLHVECGVKIVPGGSSTPLFAWIFQGLVYLRAGIYCLPVF